VRQIYLPARHAKLEAGSRRKLYYRAHCNCVHHLAIPSAPLSGDQGKIRAGFFWLQILGMEPNRTSRSSANLEWS
jgi:hypothetical protein